jgi:prepilin-type N-terminal cleavage/methylation domain-containing protein
MQAIPNTHPKQPRAGFSLIELMVVIMIILILSGIVIAAMNGSDDSRSLDSGVSRLDSLFSLARSAAITRKQTTRVLISLDGTDRSLRYATIVYKDDDGNWKIYSEGEYLPDGIYFSPALSTKTSSGGGPAVQLYRWDMTINPTTLAITQPPNDDPTAIGPFSLTGNSETISGASANRWLVFEFNPNGTFKQPGARVVLLPGILAAGTLTVPLEQGVEAADIAKGFVVFRSGKVLYFQSGEQIKEGNS